ALCGKWSFARFRDATVRVSLSKPSSEIFASQIVASMQHRTVLTTTNEYIKWTRILLRDRRAAHLNPSPMPLPPHRMGATRNGEGLVRAQRIGGFATTSN